MALSSQMGSRSGSIYGGRRRRGRGRGKRVLALIAVGALAWFGWSWFLSPGDNDPAPTDAPAVAEQGEEQQQPERSGTSLGSDESQPGSRSAFRDFSSRAGFPTAPLPEDEDEVESPVDESPARPDPAGDPEPAIVDPSPLDQADGEPQFVAAEELDDEAEAFDDIAPSRATASRGPRSDSDARRLMERGQKLYDDGDIVHAREILNDALHSGGLNRSDAADVRDLMAHINETLVFSPRVIPDDPYVDTYEVQSGDVLSRIASRHNVPWQLISKINGDLDPRRIRVGQRLKVVRGPFHVVVHKREYRLDVFLDDLYVRSFNVGLGEYDMTPVGEFIVKSPKLENPEWTNPRTGERFLPDDPENPLGGYWIGLRGTSPETEAHSGYGIHGTIEPDTIGTDASMGCVRLLPSDVAQLFAMLTEEQSRVRVVGE